jgi:hypothetical protein
MRRNLAVAGFGLMLLCTSPAWAGATGNGWTQPTTTSTPPAGQNTQQNTQSVQTWILHGKKVSCDSKRGWRHADYVSHCGHHG